MRYDFKCQTCGEVKELIYRMADKPASVPCACGGISTSLFNCDAEVLVRGRQHDVRIDHRSVPIGWEHGNTAEKQEARYRKKIGESRRLARLNDKQAIKGGIRKVAEVPREWDRMRRNQFGKDYWENDTRAKLKADGLLFHND